MLQRFYAIAALSAALAFSSVALAAPHAGSGSGAGGWRGADWRGGGWHGPGFLGCGGYYGACRYRTGACWRFDPFSAGWFWAC